HGDRVSPPAEGPIAEHLDLLEDPVLLENELAEHLPVEGLERGLAADRGLAGREEDRVVGDELQERIDGPGPAGPPPLREEFPDGGLVVARLRGGIGHFFCAPVYPAQSSPK